MWAFSGTKAGTLKVPNGPGHDAVKALRAGTLAGSYQTASVVAEDWQSAPTEAGLVRSPPQGPAPQRFYRIVPGRIPVP